MKITNRNILQIATANPNPLVLLGNYGFGHRVRYAIRYNLQTFRSVAFKELAEGIQAERAKLFEGFGWRHNLEEQRFEPGPGAHSTEEALRVVESFLSEEEDLRLRTVTFDDTGDTIFPANLMPDWMMPMEEEGEEEEPVVETVASKADAAASNGLPKPQESHA